MNDLPRRLLLSLRGKLMLLNGLVVAALIALSWQAWGALQVQQRAQSRHVELAEALHLSKQASVLHDALRADVLSSLLVGQVPGLDAFDARQRVRIDSQAYHESIAALAAINLPSEIGTLIKRAAVITQAYAGMAQELVQVALSNRAEAMASVAAFEQQFKQTNDVLDSLGNAMGELLRQDRRLSTQEAEASRAGLLWMCALTIAATSLFVMTITLAIRKRLRRLGDVAQAIADGDLNLRTGAQGGDELGDLGRAIDKMASGLNQMIDSMREDAVRASFGKHLADALDMTDREEQVARVAARAMREIAAEVPMELLVADSSQASLSRACEHPASGAPGCSVGSPYDCVAVRRGNVVSFDHSEALNACTHLRDRPCGPVAAVCVPVTFMGRAIGVLHAASAIDAPLQAEQMQQLGTLGTQIGMRIGTVRAFAKSQVEASTDGLTGLSNRRTLEQQMRLLATSDREFAVVMCDLDHFKMLNDGQGHAAGDAALRVFSDVLRSSLRESDLVGRWGGEEFTFVLVNSHARAAHEMIDRLRARLSQALKVGKSVPFTSSFGIADSSLSRQVDQLVRLADVALYQAKAQGRDRACIADGTVLQEMLDMPQTEVALPPAVGVSQGQARRAAAPQDSVANPA